MSNLRQLHCREQEQEKKEIKQAASFASAEDIPSYLNVKTHLLHKGKLLAEEEVEELKKLNLKEGYYQRSKGTYFGSHRIDCRYSIGCLNGGLYAIYREKDKSTFLGEGTFGKVKLTQNLLTGDWDTVTKIVKAQSGDEKHIQQLQQVMRNELTILKDLGQARSDFIVRTSRKTGLLKFQFFTKRAKGQDFFTCIAENKMPMDDVILKRIALNIVKEVKKFFDLGYLHRDIKIENIFIDLETEEVTLIDFGFSIKKDSKHTANDGRACGSIDTVAPEIMNGSTVFSEATEVYALGVVLRALLFGQVVRPAPLSSDVYDALFKAKQFDLLKHVINMSDIFPATESGWRLVSNLKGFYMIEDKLYRFVLEEMCNNSPEKRPSFKKIVETFEACLIPMAAKKQASSVTLFKNEKKAMPSKDQVSPSKKCIIL